MVRKTLLVKPLETAPTIEVGKPAQTPKQSNRKKASTIQKESWSWNPKDNVQNPMWNTLSECVEMQKATKFTTKETNFKEGIDRPAPK